MWAIKGGEFGSVYYWRSKEHPTTLSSSTKGTPAIVMKLYLSLVIALSLLGSALSRPQDDSIGREEFDEPTAEQIESDASDNIVTKDFEDSAAAQFSRDLSVTEEPPPAPGSVGGYDADQPDAQYYVDMQGKQDHLHTCRC